MRGFHTSCYFHGRMCHGALKGVDKRDQIPNPCSQPLAYSSFNKTLAYATRVRFALETALNFSDVF